MTRGGGNIEHRTDEQGMSRVECEHGKGNLGLEAKKQNNKERKMNAVSTKSELLEAYQCIEGKTHRVATLTNELAQRLQPVLRVSTIANAPKGAPDAQPATKAPLTMKLMKLAEEMEKQIDTMTDINNRLAI